MKLHKLFLTLLFVLFGISNVFAQCSPNMKEQNFEFKLNGDKDGFSSYEYVFPRYPAPKGECDCQVGFKAIRSLNFSLYGGFQIFNSKNDMSREYATRNNFYPKTYGAIDSHVKANDSCFKTENEFQAIKKIWSDENDQYLLEADTKKREAEDQRRKETAARKTEMDKFCKGMPKINQEIIENVSYVGKIDPQSVRLNRVNQTDDAQCIATFYTPKGVATARVGFNVNGAIVSNGPIQFPR